MHIKCNPGIIGTLETTYNSRTTLQRMGKPLVLLQTFSTRKRRYFLEMETARLALVALVTALLLFPAFSLPASGGGEDSTNQTTEEEGFNITWVDSKPQGKAIQLDYQNVGWLFPSGRQQVQKWRISCPETLKSDNLKLVLLLAYANLEPGDFLQFDNLRYEGSKFTPTVMALNLTGESILVSYVTQKGESDFELGYVCPYSNYQDCVDLHNCPVVADYAATSKDAYYTLAHVCYDPRFMDEDDFNLDLCLILRGAYSCDLPAPGPPPSCG